MSKVEERLSALGLTLPQPNPPVANYVPFVRVGDLVHISGQVSPGCTRVEYVKWPRPWPKSISFSLRCGAGRL